MSDHRRPNSTTLDMLVNVYEGNPYGEQGTHALHIPALVIDDTAPSRRAPTPEPTAPRPALDVAVELGADRAVDRAGDEASERVLRILVLVVFAACWLLPRWWK